MKHLLEQIRYMLSNNQKLAGLSKDQIEEFEERAAILEYNGGLSRKEAEKLALQFIRKGDGGGREKGNR